MRQPDRGTYNTHENVGQMFYRSCLGKFIILIGVLVIMAIIAVFTVPSESKMRKEMTDNIRQCIQENDSIKGDQLDDALGNLLHMFTSADSTVNDKEMMNAFYKYNRLEIYHHSMYATAYIHNNFRPEGTRVGVGIFGIVIPTVNFNDFLLHVGPMRREYQDVPARTITTGDYAGENPDVEPYKGPAE